ncbi:nuclease-related domain-containing protein [Alkalihalophilus marmarensis]|uniref:nuclease-related domain-containing protein n=1 Tax=Alkalihalophilus marmarensis TaxID=521377 RepID=UPI002DBB28E1|nr:nuclease-related domain-containing protein [Alkalihalophilus marmarensis]MEC2073458.1 nuclease-related domain-containing protein [Alkalihalophilus marmarensis]
MIRKQRETPIHLLQIEALHRRLAPHHSKKNAIEEELYKYQAGLKGEQSLDYFLDPFNSDQYSVLHDIRLPLNGQHFQMDSIIIAPTFILILEVKNLSGTLHFDLEYNQLLRSIQGKEEVFPDPILQVARQEQFLTEWLKQQAFPDMPIYSLIIVANPNSKIEVSGGTREQRLKILHLAKVPYVLSELLQKGSPSKLSDKQCEDLIKQLMSQHTSYTPNILSYFKLHPYELLTGIHCANCNALPMRKVYGGWLCAYCNYHSRTPFVDALTDYRLLINESITNKELRRFLGVPTRNIANKILRQLTLKRNGITKGTSYSLERIGLK